MPQSQALEIDTSPRIRAALAGDKGEFTALAEPYRRELSVHCYRMLGSLQDAEDLVQETLLRAWQKLDTYEGRATFRAWLYKIATNACLDALARRPKRTLPPQLQPPADPSQPSRPPLLEQIWLEPFPDDLLAEETMEPEARYAARESITLAFLAALQLLPARQRAILILRDVLDWEATEVARLLEITVAAVNSALHRARVTLAKNYHARGVTSLSASPADERTRDLLARYIRAWEDADVDGLVALLKEDATFPMPPSPSWYQGREAIRQFVAANIFVGNARGRWRAVPTSANGRPAFAMYGLDDNSGIYRAFGIEVLTLEGDKIADITTFLNPTLLHYFNLPLEIDSQTPN